MGIDAGPVTDPGAIAVEEVRRGRISPEVAIARMVLAGLDVAAIRQRLVDAPGGPATDAMRSLLDRHAERIHGLSCEVAATMAQHSAAGATEADGIARIAAFFDRAVAHSPEAGVALYSLGDAAILAAATDEIVGFLDGHHLVPPGAAVLDIGCGIGRLAAALAPRCRAVLGLDVSAGMVAEARRRLAGHRHVRIEQTDGIGLDGLEPMGFDLVLAVDSFPYIVQNGEETVRRHVAGAARALRPGGTLCILNWSYRGDPALDRAEAAGWARASGLEIGLDGVCPFRLWDGRAYTMRRPSSSGDYP